MDFVSIILIAIGLSMDSFVVSLTNGLTIYNINTTKIIAISFSLAFFQATMPLIGWFAGMGIEKYITAIDHWVAFLLLAFIGIRMIYEGVNRKDLNYHTELNLLTLLGQSVATSIDALVVGISFAILNFSIWIPVLIIGFVTFGFALTGLYLGKYFGKKTGRFVSVIGGLVIIGIGIKILIEHLYFN
ncbi:MAG: manganese efflux pump [Chlorobi bacterium]|nr:manganese efflux pump [Chlorobiota bacterium]